MVGALLHRLLLLGLVALHGLLAVVPVCVKVTINQKAKVLTSDDTWISEYFEHLPVIPEPVDLGDEGERQLGEADEEAPGAAVPDQDDHPEDEGSEDQKTGVNIIPEKNLIFTQTKS